MIKVLLVDDEQLVRAGLRLILQAADDIEVVAEAADGTQAVDAARQHQPDVVLMDIRMPVLDGLAATKQITALPHSLRIVILTTFKVDEYVYAALQNGAVGFLFKNTPPRELIAAVRTVAAGNAILAPEVTTQLIAEFASGNQSRATTARKKIENLTPREREVLLAVAQGLSNAEISQQLYLSEATVKAHVGKLFTKLELTNRVQVAILAHDANLV